MATFTDFIQRQINWIRVHPLAMWFCLLALTLRVVFWVYTDRIWEDALITALHSENFHSGLGLTHVRIDDPRPLHGFTSPISVMIPLAGDFLSIGFGLTFQRIMSVIAGGVAMIFLYLIIQELRLAPTAGKSAFILSATYVAAEHHQVLWGMAGMETQVVVAILFANFYYLMRDHRNGFAITAALCVYARPDFAIWSAAAYCIFAWHRCRRGDFRSVLAAVLITSLLYLPWVIFTCWYYGSVIPNTITAKSLGYKYWWREARALPETFQFAGTVLMRQILAPLGPTFAGNGTGFWPLPAQFPVMVAMLALAGVGAIACFFRRFVVALPLILFPALFAAFNVFLAPIIFGWYVVPIVAVLAIVAGFGLGVLTEAIAPRFHILGLIGAVALMLPVLGVLPKTFTGERNLQRLVENRVRKQIGLFLRDEARPDQTIGGEPLGYIAYYSHRTYYDYPGLCSRRVVDFLKRMQVKYKNAHLFIQMLADIRPGFIVFRTGEYNAYQKEFDGKFLKSEYVESKWFRIRPEDREKLLMPEHNIDTEFVLLRRLPPEALPILEFDADVWFNEENNPQRRWRWSKGNATLLLNRSSGVASIKIDAILVSHARPQTVKLLDEQGAVLWQQAVAPGSDGILHLTLSNLKVGRNVLRLISDQPALRANQDDVRLLGFALYDWQVMASK